MGNGYAAFDLEELNCAGFRVPLGGLIECAVLLHVKERSFSTALRIRINRDTIRTSLKKN